MMTRREVFDKVRDHLLTQNKQSLQPSTSGEVSCVYRGPNGLSCAVGCLIPDSKYNKNLEGSIISYYRKDSVARALSDEVPRDETTMIMLRSLQRIHDHHNPDCWKEKLDKLELEVQF